MPVTVYPSRKLQNSEALSIQITPRPHFLWLPSYFSLLQFKVRSYAFVPYSFVASTTKKNPNRASVP